MSLTNKIVSQAEDSAINYVKKSFCNKTEWTVVGGSKNIDQSWQSSILDMRDLVFIHASILEFLMKYNRTVKKDLDSLKRTEDYYAMYFDSNDINYRIGTDLVILNHEMKVNMANQEEFKLKLRVFGINSKSLYTAIIRYVSRRYKENPVRIYSKKKIFYVNEYTEVRYINEPIDESFNGIIGPFNEKIKSSINRYMKNENIYKKFSKKYTHNIYLYGKPGTGKTTIVKAIANELSIPIYIISPDSNYVQFLRDDLVEFVGERKAIVLFEEIDMFFKENKSTQPQFQNNVISNESKITFLMQYLDGFNSVSNVINVLTTNYPDNIDSRLVREGRINLSIELGDLEYEYAIKLAKKFELNDDEMFNIFKEYNASIYDSKCKNIDIKKCLYNPAKLENMILKRLCKEE